MSISELLVLHDGYGMVRGVEVILAQIAPARQVNVLNAFPSTDEAVTGVVVCVNFSTIRNVAMHKPSFDISGGRSVFVLPAFGVGYVAALEKPGTARYLIAPAALIETVSGVW